MHQQHLPAGEAAFEALWPLWSASHSWVLTAVMCAASVVVAADVPKDAEAICKRMQQQWKKLKGRSDEVGNAAVVCMPTSDRTCATGTQSRGLFW